jgi:hypothetical protein
MLLEQEIWGLKEPDVSLLFDDLLRNLLLHLVSVIATDKNLHFKVHKSVSVGLFMSIRTDYAMFRDELLS